MNGRDPTGASSCTVGYSWLYDSETGEVEPGSVLIDWVICDNAGNGAGGSTATGQDTKPNCTNFSASDCQKIRVAITDIRKAAKVNPVCGVVADNLQSYFEAGQIVRQPDYTYPGKGGLPGSSQFGTWQPGRIGINDITLRGGTAPNGGPVPSLREVLAHEGFHATFPKTTSGINDTPGHPVYDIGSLVCGHQ